jgi:methionyl-tRNA formyltransferase
MKPRNQFRIVFMGTPAFAVRTLEVLHKSGYPVLAVVTVPDKPAGRGLKPRASDVKRCAEQHDLPLLQPDSLKDQEFISSLASLKADLFVVVAFRMLPESVWSLPAMGTINLHASLLPQYRGAAPINRAIINGETKTGVTTFLIDHEIDTGELLLQEEIIIGPEETAGELHDRLMETGASLVLKTVDAIRENKTKPVKQNQLISQEQVLKKAPKLSKEDCKINWNCDAETVFNQIRGLSPYPAAFTNLLFPDGIVRQLKIFKAGILNTEISPGPGEIRVDTQSRMFIGSNNAAIEILEVQLSGKAKMKVRDFLNGLRTTAGLIAK